MIFLQPPEATNKGSGFNRGAGGGARRCGVEERAAAYAHTEGDIPYSSRCLSVWCVCGHLIDRWFSRQIILKMHVKDLAEDVLDAAKDGSVKVLILPIVIFQRRNAHSTHTRATQRLPLGDT